MQILQGGGERGEGRKGGRENGVKRERDDGRKGRKRKGEERVVVKRVVVVLGSEAGVRQGGELGLPFAP